MASTNGPPFKAFINYEDPYVQPLILEALANRLPQSAYQVISSAPDQDDPDSKRLLQISDYESLDFELALCRDTYLINAYIIRKALIRKHFLSTTVANWIVKHPDSVLRHHVKPAVEFELDYAEFLDDALVEAFELHDSFARNESKAPHEREWWILKPSMSDRGQGIRLFSTETELTTIFEEWEGSEPDSPPARSDDGDNEGDGASQTPTDDEEHGIITSQLRHFVAQPYIHPPLLLPSAGDRKFHIRTYVLAAGALRVWVYRPMLALFAAAAYTAPGAAALSDGAPDLRAHLTNTCLQGTNEREGSVRAFWDLPDSDGVGAHGPAWKENVFQAICNATGELFEAAARGMLVHFQPLPNAFELYGVDFLVDAQGVPWLLEVNAFPDFRQTGDELKGLVRGLFEGVVDEVVKPFFGIDTASKGDRTAADALVPVLDIDLGRR
jgi:tubulin---tyrosine ligase